MTTRKQRRAQRERQRAERQRQRTERENTGRVVAFFVWSAVLGVIWAITLGVLTGTNLLIGSVVGFAVLIIGWRDRSTDFAASRIGIRKLATLTGFLAYFVWALLLSNLRMALYAIGPRSLLRPGIVGVPLGDMTDVELTSLANTITLTPGTLTVDISSDRRTIYVHVMDARDPERIRHEIKHGFERRIKDIFR